MRTIVFFNESEFDDISGRAQTAKIPLSYLNEAQAYKHLLEVICGLKSEIAGETQVLGQFKIFLTALKKEHHSFYLNHSVLFQSLLQDCKELREKHIQNWGGSSYGSLTRKLVERTPHVSVLGNGQLAKSLIPWLKEKKSVVYVRNPRKPLEQMLDCSLISNYPQPSKLRSLVVAAPVDNSFLYELFQQVAFHQAIDWRTEARLETGQLPGEVNYHSYKYLVASIENEIIKNKKNIDLLTDIIQQKTEHWNRRKHVISNF